MGGYGSGGHNKTHRQLENFRRIDSFSFYDYLKGDKYLFCKETVKYPLFRGDIVYYVGEGMAEIREGDSYTDLVLSSVPGIDGKSTRLFIVHIAESVSDTFTDGRSIICAGTVQS